MITGVQVVKLSLSQVSKTLCYRAVATSKQRLSWSATEQKMLGIIDSITVRTATTLVPEIKLHLITPQCPLWRSRPEDSPIEDPYWAFFWPGGQALCRYLLDNTEICSKKNVLDIGSGSGALAIAAAASNAKLVVANDIDPIANIAIKMNIDLNKELGQLATIIQLNSSDILPIDLDRPLKNYLNRRRLAEEDNQHPHPFDVVLVGDMCYDDAMASRLYTLLNAIQIDNPDVCILLGDPGRHAMKVISGQVDLLQEYPLPLSSDYSWGFPSACVYRFRL